MTAARSYTAAEIIEMIQILRSSGDISQSELAGMEFLGKLLIRLDKMSDSDIAGEVQRCFRSD